MAACSVAQLRKFRAGVQICDVHAVVFWICLQFFLARAFVVEVLALAPR